MSYADVTAKNAHQSAAEARAPPVPELEHHEVPSTTTLIDADQPHISAVPSDFESQSIKTSTQADRIERENKARRAREEAEQKAKQLQSDAKRRGKQLRENKDHPVILGNAVLSVALFGALGYGAYVKYRAGEFGWKVVGIGAAVLGAFSVADYYASRYLFQRYPPKK